MASARPPLRVSLLAIPDAMTFTLNGLYDVLNSFGMLSTHDYALPREPPFLVEIVALSRGLTPTASGLPVEVHASVGEVARTDLVIIPSVMVAGGQWRTGRYPEVVQWLREMHGSGATLCSACSGLLLLAETGLLSGREATMHWAYEQTFRRNFPDVQLRLEEMLVTAGEHQEFVMSGASMAWHDLVLYLIARYVGTAAAQVDRALLCHAVARRRSVTLYRLRAANRPRRCRGVRRPALARAQLFRGEPGGGDGQAIRHSGAQLQAPLHAGHGNPANCLCATAQDRICQAQARTVRHTGGRGQLGCRLHRARVLSQAVQACDGHRPWCLPAQIPRA